MPNYPFHLTPGGPRLVTYAFEKTGGKNWRDDAEMLYIGSSYGENVFAMAEQFPGSIVGADEDAEALFFCKSRIGDLRPRVSFRMMSPVALDPRDGTIDAVIVDGVLSSYNKRKLLREVRRVLKPGAPLLVAAPVWLEDGAPTGIRGVWETREYTVPTRAELADLLAECGFRIVHESDQTRVLEPFYKQFMTDVKKLAAAGFEEFKQHRALVKHYKHEIDMYFKHGGRRYMGYVVIGARAAGEEGGVQNPEPGIRSSEAETTAPGEGIQNIGSDTPLSPDADFPLM